MNDTWPILLKNAFFNFFDFFFQQKKSFMVWDRYKSVIHESP